MPTEAVLPESDLRSRVQQRILEGRLPLTFVTPVNAGFGVGQVCAVCDTPVTGDKVEYHVVDPRNATDQLTFHFACYVAWQRECARRVRAGNSPLGGGPGVLGWGSPQTSRQCGALGWRWSIYHFRVVSPSDWATNTAPMSCSRQTNGVQVVARNGTGAQGVAAARN